MTKTDVIELLGYGFITIVFLFIFVPLSILLGAIFIFKLFRAIRLYKKHGLVAESNTYSRSKTQRPYNNQGQGLVCSICGKSHGMLHSVRNAWHKCTRCGTIYCDECGNELPREMLMPVGVRKCNCGSRTNLIFQ